MNNAVRIHMIERIARTLAWDYHSFDMQKAFRRKAETIVDDLFVAEAEGHAVRRGLKIVEERIA